MTIAANLAVALVALLHLYFLVLEMFFWDKPLGRRAFGLTLVIPAQAGIQSCDCLVSTLKSCASIIASLDALYEGEQRCEPRLRSMTRLWRRRKAFAAIKIVAFF